ncbi:MAG: hypothetical protein ACTSSH_07490 [Candidatus Heimdallarchaeota archaeon]
MSEKTKPKTATKKPAAKSTKAKKTTTAAKKPARTKKATSTKKPTTTPKKTTSTKKKTTTTTKKPATKKPAVKKAKTIRAKILSYRRSNRLQTTNQAIAKILDDCNHKALIGKKLVLEFSDSDAVAKATVVATHGQDKNRQVRIRFDKKGMTAHAINQIAEIYL